MLFLHEVFFHSLLVLACSFGTLAFDPLILAHPIWTIFAQRILQILRIFLDQLALSFLLICFYLIDFLLLLGLHFEGGGGVLDVWINGPYDILHPNPSFPFT